MPTFLVPIDLAGNELENPVFHLLATPPGSPQVGQFYWNTAQNRPFVWDGTAWKDMLGAEGALTALGVTAPITSTGGASPTIGISDATTGARGAMTAADKTKLNGIATGATANATDAQLRDRTTHTGAQAIATVTGLQAALDAKEATANRNQANGYPGLDGTGKLATSVLPNIAITDTYVVATQAAMLALSAEVGDVAVRTDTDQTFILRASPATTLANWELLRSPTDGVTAVTGTAPITSTGGNAPAIGLADSGVTTAKLANTAVTAAKLGAVAGTGLTGGNGTALNIDPAIVPRKHSADLAAATTTVITHNLGTRDVQVTVRETAAPYAQVYADVEMTTTNTITVRFATAPTAGAFRATVVG